jgi:hypothetical protein
MVRRRDFWTLRIHHIVAMYFAFEDERPEKHQRSAVWAIDLDWLKAKGRELLNPDAAMSANPDLGSRSEYVNQLLGEERPVIVLVNPKQMNRRMGTQQGIFLCKLIQQATFNQILMSMMMHSKTTDRPVIRKLEVGKDQCIKFLKNLREMNIHHASLFPGLDGFGRSLKLDLEIKVKDEEP